MKQYKILVVEDERMLAEIMMDKLTDHGFSARVCYNAPEALAAVASDRPDLILMDVVIPGMDGWELLSKLKSQPVTASIPVIMCTGKDSIDDINKSYRSGAQAYVIKPYSYPILIKKIAAVLDIEKLLG